MKTKDIAAAIEQFAPLDYQEQWDNAGFQVGDPEADVTGVLLCTDVTEEVISEAISLGYNMVVSHHPLIFHPLKKLLGRNHVERMVATALREGVTIYSGHTNVDNAPGGVSWVMADKLSMTSVELLVGHEARDGRQVGCGVIGNIVPMSGTELLARLRDAFGVAAIRYSGPVGHTVERVALCGGAGAFLLDTALQQGAQAFVTADIRYHEYMTADDRLLLADIGHFESEQYTKELFFAAIRGKNPNFAVAFAKNEANPMKYFQ